MALAAGPKTKKLNELPPKRAVVPWIEHATGQKLYPWQRDVLRDLTATQRPRLAYIQVPRKNGKTRLAAVLALAEVCLKERRHVYAIADSEKNLNSVLMRELHDLIGGSEHLRNSIHIFKDKIEVPETGSFIQTRPNNFRASQGINPHLVLFDEVHLQNDDKIWSGMQQAGRARDDALLFGITTPGYDLTSMAHGLYQRVKAGDPDIYGKVYEGDPTAEIDNRANWKLANPCYGRPGFVDALAFDMRTLAEHEFRRFALGNWTATESAWLAYGVWDDLARPIEPPPPGTKVWLGFDGSYSGDSTGLVGCTAEGHLFVVGCWEKPGTKEWRVPRLEVHDAVEGAFTRWDVQEMICDPPYWQSEIAHWIAKYGENRVIGLHTYSRAQFAPACTGFYAAVMDANLTHDGDKRLARHIANCVVQSTSQGDVITKADKDSPAKVDLAVAAVLAHSRASIHVAKPRAKAFVLVG